jgi:glucuronoarabinoxylan endo-1,4-beta-xylanase
MPGKLVRMIIAGWLLIGFALASGCGGAGSGSPETPPASCTVAVNTGTTYQTLEGFGASIAWYGHLLTGNPKSAEIYNLLFQDSGLDILRLRNTYGNRNDRSYGEKDIVAAAKQRNPALKVMLSSWSPPRDLKANGTMNGGTLAKVNGAFNYSGFAQYWYEALNAYAAAPQGFVPDYISIQNEPDYQNPGWETCIFRATENDSYPGYGAALNAVYQRLQSLPAPPQMIGPETAGISSSIGQYCANMNLAQVYGIAHHLYNGGTGSNTSANINPDGFITNMQGLANSYYPNKPLFQTEYDYGTPLQTGQLMINSLIHENVSAYCYWDLIWAAGQRPLVTLTGNDYSVSDFYYVFKQFAKYTDPGYKRVAAVSDAGAIKTVALISPDQKQLSVILINPGGSTTTVALNLNGFTVSGSTIYRTVPGGTEKCSAVGALGSGNTVALPARSIATVVIQTF